MTRTSVVLFTLITIGLLTNSKYIPVPAVIVAVSIPSGNCIILLRYVIKYEILPSGKKYVPVSVTKPVSNVFNLFKLLKDVCSPIILFVKLS